MRSVLRQIPLAPLALLVASGCATATVAGQGFDGRAKQADDRLPAASRFYDEAERTRVEAAQQHQAAARKAVEDRALEQARTEFAAAAEQYVAFADAYPTSEWRIPFRFTAAEYLLFAQRQEPAAVQAERVLADAAATDASKAMAAHLAAVAWRAAAVQRIKSGDGEPIHLTAFDQRHDAPLAPRAPSEPWKRFVQAVDAWLPLWQKHPEAAKRGGVRGLTLPPWQAALIAAEVRYSCDDMEDAERRLEAIVEAWPAEAEVMESAVPLLLQAHLVRKDDAGFAAARERVEKALAAQVAAAGDAKAREPWGRLQETVRRLAQGVDFGVAKRLLDAGKPAEAAAGFERFAEANPAAADAPNALFNAAVAWDQAGQPAKASEARARIVERYAEAKVAPRAALYLAGASSRQGDHDGAARRYAAFIERWPDAPDRCLAMQNIGYELDVQNRKADAAERYLAFGAEARCAKERPNEAAKALYRGAKLFSEAKQKAKAKQAYEAASRIEGVTDPAARQQVEDARKQLERL